MTHANDPETREWLRSQLDIVRLARELVGERLKRQGAVHRGPCPCCGAGEHRGKAPFLVDPRSTPKYPHYKCFACDDKGDVFTLFARHHHLSLKNDFPAVVAGLAAWAGVTLPERPAAPRASRAAALRSATQEVWAVAHAWLEEELCAGARAHTIRSHLARVGADNALLREARLGYYSPALATHLDQLGISGDIRRRAGLTTEALTRVPEGLVVLRTHGRVPAGISHVSPTGPWVHLTGIAAAPDPAFLTMPRGRPGARSFVVAGSLSSALQAAAALRTIAAAADHSDAKACQATGVVLWSPDDLAELSGLHEMTERALIVTASPHQARAASVLGTQLIQAGFGVRVVLTPKPSTDAVACAEALLRAPHYLDWQWTMLRGAMTPDAATTDRWVRQRVQPLITRVSDPTHRAILAHRAATLAASAGPARTA